MQRTLKQNKQLHYLLGELKVDNETKEELVYNASNGRVVSSADLTVSECEALIKHLKPKVSDVKRQQMIDKAAKSDKMRKKILSICHEMGWELENGKVDMERVNRFCVRKGPFKKPLDAHLVNELPQLVTQFEQLQKKFYAEG